jgi:uncharacterized protein
MSNPVTNLAELLRTMRPTLHEGTYVFTSVSPGIDVSSLEPIATFREAEGLTLIVDERQVRKAGLPVLFRAAWITLTVHSDLQAVGLTAAVATALAQANISCNVVAAAFHDHLFVPVKSANEALLVLQQLQHDSSRSTDPSVKSSP